MSLAVVNPVPVNRPHLFKPGKAKENRHGMPTIRARFSAEEVNGKIYAFGGEYRLGPDYYDVVEEYDPVSNTWSTKTAMPTGRNTLTTSIIDGKIIVIGGRHAGGSTMVVEEYDPVNDSWISKTALTEDEYWRHGNAVYNNKIYLFGGSKSYESGTGVKVYDPALD